MFIVQGTAYKAIYPIDIKELLEEWSLFEKLRSCRVVRCSPEHGRDALQAGVVDDGPELSCWSSIAIVDGIVEAEFVGSVVFYGHLKFKTGANVIKL
jgi:hypothetical protein